MREAIKLIKAQSDALGEMLNQSYETMLLRRLEATQTGDDVGEFPSTHNDRAGSISLHDLSQFDVTV